MDRCYILHAKTVASPAIQIAGALKYGFKAADLSGDYGSHRVYIDKRMPGQKVGDWLVKLIDQTRPGDVIHLWDLSVLGGKDGIIADRLSEIAAQEASVRLTSTGALIKPTADTVATITAMRQARETRNKKSNRVMMQAKRRSGILGGAKPRFFPDDWAKVLPVWVRAKTQTEAVLLAEKALGRPISYSQMFRQAKKANWPERGSGKAPKPTTTKRKAKRRSKR